MKVLRIPEGAVASRYREAGVYDGFYDSGAAERRLAVLKHVKQLDPYSHNWLPENTTERSWDGRLTQTIWVVLPDDIYARLTEPEVNAWGEVSP